MEIIDEKYLYVYYSYTKICNSYILLLDECPWMTPTTQNDVMQCRDGTFCNVKTDAAKFECCKSHNGRGKCPKNSPLMCANKKCDGQTDYCCHGSNHYKDCDGNGHGGPRLCTSASFQAGSKDSGIYVLFTKINTFSSFI